MWENEIRKNVIRNIILALIIVAVCAGLVYAMLMVHKKTEAEDVLLVEAYSQRQQEQNAARQEGVLNIEAEYAKDLQTIEQYLPGIVCWGDSITAGSSGNVSYPYVLQKYIDAYICDIYDFRQSIENAEEYSRLKWDDYNVDIPVVNMGAGPEDVSTVLGRAGVVPYTVSADFTIPEDTTPVEVNLLSMNGKAVAPLTGGSVGVNNVHINGVEGTLSLVSSANIWESNRYFFSRTQPGQETYVQAGSIVTTSATEMYKDYIHVVCIGTYGGYATPDELVQSTKALLSRQIKNSDRYIVLGVCSDGNGFNSYGSYMNLDAIDSSMMQAFGNKYINVRKYLCEDGLSDAGLKATDADLYNISCGMVPESFRSASGGAELNGKAYNLIGKLVYDRMESLGYFDEVVSELYIKETIKQLLKEDPNYLTNVIENTLNR